MPDPLQGPGPSPIPFSAPSTTYAPSEPPAQLPNQNQTPNQTPPKKRMSILIFVLAGFLILAIVGASIFFIYPKFIKQKTETQSEQTVIQPNIKHLPTESPQASASALVQSKDSKFTSSDFSIIGPAYWTKITGSAGSIVLFQNAAADTDANGQTFGASIAVSTDFLQSDMTLDEYSKGTDIQRQKTEYGYKPLKQIKGTMGNQIAIVDLYLAKIGNIDVKQGQIYTIKNHNAYVLTFNAQANSWDKYAQIFDTAAQSFQFICNTGACSSTK